MKDGRLVYIVQRVEDITAHAGEVAVFIFEFKATVVEGHEFDIKFERPRIKAAPFAAKSDVTRAGFEFANRLRIIDADGGI